MSSNRSKIDLSTRIEAVKYALEEGIVPSSVKYKVSERSVRRWIKSYRENRLETVGKRVGRRWDRLPDNITEQIIECREKNPSWSGKKIKKELGLQCSIRVIYKRINERGLIPERSRGVLTPSSLTIKDSLDRSSINLLLKVNRIRYNDYETDNRKILYRYEIYDLETDCKYYSFSNELSNISIAIFFDYFIYNLKLNSDKREIKLYTDRNQIFTRNRYFDHLILKKYSVKHYKIERLNSKFIRSKKRLELSKFRFSENDIMIDSFVEQIEHNLSHHNKRNLYTANIVPIKIDHFFKEVEGIIFKNTFWSSHSEIRENVLSESLKSLHLKGMVYRYRYDFKKVVSNFDKILVLLKNSNKRKELELKVETLLGKGNLLYRFDQKILAESIFKKGLYISKQIENINLIINSRLQIAELQYLEGRYDIAKLHLKKALSILSDKSDKLNQIRIYRSFGALFRRKGDLDRSIEYYNKILHLTSDKIYTTYFLETKLAIGDGYLNKGMIVEANNFFMECLKSSREIKDSIIMAESYVALGTLSFTQYSFEKAEKFYNKALNLYKKDRDIKGIAKLYKLIGNVKSSTGKIEEALKLYISAKKIYKQLLNSEGIVDTNINISIIFGQKGEYTKAIRYTKNYFKYANEIDRKDILLLTYHNLGILYFKSNKLISAENSLNKGIALAREIGDKQKLCANLYVMAKSKLGRDCLYAARKAVNEAFEIALGFHQDSFITTLRVLKSTISWRIEINSAKRNSSRKIDLRPIIALEKIARRDNGEDKDLNYSQTTEIEIAELNYSLWRMISESITFLKKRNVKDPQTLKWIDSTNPNRYRKIALKLFNGLKIKDKTDYREQIEILVKGDPSTAI